MTSIEWINSAGDQWLFFIKHAAWQAALLGLVVLFAVTAFTRLPSQLRYCLLVVALAKFVIPPMIALPTGIFGLVTVASPSLTEDSSVPRADAATADAATAGHVDIKTDLFVKDDTAQLERLGKSDTPEIDTSADQPGMATLLQNVPQTSTASSKSPQDTDSESNQEESLSEGTIGVATKEFRKRPAAQTALSLPALGLLIHAVGVVFFSTLLITRTIRLHSIAGKECTSQRLLTLFHRCSSEIGLRRSPVLRVSEHNAGPFSFGWIQPSIVIPRSCVDQLSDEELRTVFAHELIHHHRKDLLINVLQMLVVTLWWFHPVVWLISRAIRRVREDCCDDVILSRKLVQDDQYCATLLRVADCHANHQSLANPVALSMAESGHPLGNRFRRIMDDGIPRFAKLSRRSVAIVVTVAVVVLPGIHITRFVQAEVVTETSPETSTHREAQKASSDEDKEISTWPRTMQVRVVDERQQGVADATVRVGNDKGVLAEYRTDNDGSATVEFPKSRPRHLSVVVDAPPYIPLGAWWYPKRSPDKVPPAEMTFPLSRGIEISGKVVDENSQPIAGARILAEIVSTAPRGRPRHTTSGYEAISKEDGKWVLDRLPDGLSRVNLKVQHDQFISDPTFWKRSLKGDELTKVRDGKYVAVLREGVNVSGSVTDLSGKPIAGAIVSMGDDMSTDHAERPVTDVDGRYEFRQCDAISTFLTVFKPGLAPELKKIAIGSFDSTYDFELSPGNRVRFEVVDQSGQPLPSVRISPDTWRDARTLAFSKHQYGHDFGETDHEGMWTWNWAPEDEIKYYFSKSGYMGIARKPFKPSDEPHTVQMQSELQIRGTVVDDQTGEPIKAFRVTPGTTNRRGKRPQSWHRLNTVNASDGAYVITIDHEYEAHAIRVEADGYQPVVSRAIQSDEGKITLDFQLTQGSGVNGVVLAADGSPEADANVILGTVADRPYIRANGESLGRRGFSKRTDKDGRFRFGPQDADYTVFVFGKSGFAHVPKSKFVDANGSPTKMNLSPWARIEGAIHTSARSRENESSVKLEFAGAMGGQSFFGQHCFFDYQAKIDADGKFVFDRVPPGTEVTIYQTVSIRHGRMTQVGRGASATFALGEGQIRKINLGTQGRSVTGHLEVNADVEVGWDSIMGTLTPSDPLQEEGVSYQPTGSFRIEKNGDFRLEGVPPGSYRLSVRATTPRASLHERGEMIGDIKQSVTVPPAKNETDNDAFDLGTLTIQPSNRREWASPKTAKMSALLSSTDEPAKEPTKSSSLNLTISDSSGKPISESTVSVWCVSRKGVEHPASKSLKPGTVQINEIPPHGAWVFASAPGYRFKGGYFAGDDSDPKLVLERDDESSPISIVSSLRIDGVTRQLLKQSLRDLANAIMRGKDERIKFQLERFLAEYDPKFALETHAANTIDFAGFTQDADSFSTWHHSVVLSIVARELAKSHPDRATEVIESIQDRGKRVWAYSEAANEIIRDRESFAENRQIVLGWLTRAHKDALETPKSHERAENLTRIAGQLMDIQKNELASKIFQEAIEAANTPSDDERAVFSRSFTAWRLAPYDLATALVLISDLSKEEQLTGVEIRQLAEKMSHASDNRERERLREQLSAIHTRDRAIGNIAHQIAAIFPEKSEELLSQVGPRHDDYAVRVCYRMATHDIQKARALAEKIQDPVYRGVALGVIAEVLSNKDTEAAQSLMREAFEQFEMPSDSDQSRHLTPVKAAVSLLPSVEKVDPARVSHYMWKAISLRGQQTCNSGCVGPVCQLGTTGPDKKLRAADALLGAVLARYDRDVARRLAFAPGDETLDLAFDEAPYFLFGVSTLLDPKATIEAATKMPHDTPYQQRTKLAALQQILPLINKNVQERWDWFMDEQFQVWRIDKLDL